MTSSHLTTRKLPFGYRMTRSLRGTARSGSRSGSPKSHLLPIPVKEDRADRRIVANKDMPSLRTTEATRRPIELAQPAKVTKSTGPNGSALTCRSPCRSIDTQRTSNCSKSSLSLHGNQCTLAITAVELFDLHKNISNVVDACYQVTRKYPSNITRLRSKTALSLRG